MNNIKLQPAVSLENFFKDKSHSDYLKNLRNSFFLNILTCLYPEPGKDSTTLIAKVVILVWNLSISLQVTSFLWNSDIGIPDWQKFEIFWRFVSFSRVDLLFAYLKNIRIALILTNCTLFGLLSLYLMCQILTAYEKTPYTFVIIILNKGSKIVSTILFLPMITILLIDLKYYYNNQPTIQEYSVPNESYGQFSSLLRSVSSIIVLLWINILYECFCFEIRHSFKNKSILAKAEAGIDIKAKTLYTFVVILNVLIYEMHPQLFQFIVFCLYVYISSQYLLYLPYYSFFANSIKVLISTSEAFIALSFLVGYIVNSSEVILILAVFVTPCLCSIVYRLISYRYSQITKIDPDFCSISALELYYRGRLSDSSSIDPQILKKIDKRIMLEKLYYSKLACIWQTYYCIDVMHDIRLAFIKLSKAWKCPYGLILDFQIFKCAYELNSIPLEDLEDLSYLRYALKFESTKREDMNLSICLLKFWGELITTGDTKKLNDLAIEASTGLTSIKESYEYLIINFMASSKCREYYRSFLIEVYVDPEQMHPIVSRLNSKKDLAEQNNLTYFDEKGGIILVSGNKQNLGEIIYANLKFAEILDQSIASIIGSNISTYIPGDYSRNHNQALSNFIAYCTESEVPFSGSLFLQTEKGNLVESTIRSRCVAIDSSVFFLAVVRRISMKRHIILVSYTGIIVSYSKQATEFLGLPNIKMMAIQEFFPFSLEDLQIDKMYSFGYRHRQIGVVKSFRQVAKTVMFVLLIYETESDMMECECKKNEEAKEVCRIDSENQNKRKGFKVGFADETLASLHTAMANGTLIESNYKDRKVEKSSHSSNSGSSINFKYSRKIMNEAIKGITIYKYILLVFVLVAIATSVTILSRVSVEVSNENDVNLNLFIGNVLESMISVAVSSNLMSLSPYLNQSSIVYNETLSNNTLLIEEIIIKLTQNPEESWSSCRQVNFLKDPLLPVINYVPYQVYSYMTLLEFLDQFRLKISSFQNKFYNNEAFENDLAYLINNGAIVTFHFIRDRNDESIQCSKDRANNINWTKNMILYLGIIALSLSISTVIYFVFALSRKINQLWTFLSKISLSSYRNSKIIYLNRLSIVNGIEEAEMTEHLIKDSGRVISFSIKWSQIWKYIWRLLIFSFLSIGFYLIITLVYCAKLEEAIVGRSFLILDIARKNYLLLLMNFYILDLAKEEAQNISTTVNNKENLFDARFEMDLLLADYNMHMDYVKVAQYNKYMTSEVIKMIFESVSNDTSKFLNFGLHCSLHFLINEVYFELSSLKFEDFFTFFEESMKLFDYHKNLKFIIDSAFKDNLNMTFKIIVIATVLYSIASILLYVFLYLPYLRSEVQHLHRIHSLARLACSFERKDESCKKKK